MNEGGEWKYKECEESEWSWEGGWGVSIYEWMNEWMDEWGRTWMNMSEEWRVKICEWEWMRVSVNIREVYMNENIKININMWICEGMNEWTHFFSPWEKRSLPPLYTP